MITYVNTVLVSDLSSSNLLSAAPASAANMNTPSTDEGKFVVMTMDENAAMITTTSGGSSTTAADSSFPYITSANADKYNTIRVGIVTKKNAPKVNPATGATTYEPIVKWSNIITKDSLKSVVETEYIASTEDTVTIDFSNLNSAVKTTLSQGGKRIIVRLTFKDLPTRYRKWTESYEYVTVSGDDESSIPLNIANMINKEWKRARVIATHANNAVTLTAMPYDDDNVVDSISWANKVRFNVNLYYTDPAAEGWASLNKNEVLGVTITKTPGVQYVGEAKIVRDREAQAMGYQGILNRGEGTYPIIKPDMAVDLSKTYAVTTVEFERQYRAADDIFRKTKECLELYAPYGVNSKTKAIDTTANGLAGINAIINAFKA